MRVLIGILLFNICVATFCFPEDISSYPERIVSLGPALTEQIYLLGAEDKLVGVTRYCQRPAQAQEKEKVGTVLEANLEKIAYLEPNLVLATGLTNPKTIEKLKRLNINVVTFPQAKNFSQINEQFSALARLVGRQERAGEILSRAKRRIDVLERRVKHLAKKKVFAQVGANPLFAAGPDSFINDCIRLAGGINVVSGTRSGLYSREKVLQDNPDVIIIATMGIVGKEEKQQWQNFKSLSAVKNNQIYIVDEYIFCSSTPPSFVQALEKMIALLHGENG